MIRIRNDPDLNDLVKCIDSRDFEHHCEICKDFSIKISIPVSGTFI